LSLSFQPQQIRRKLPLSEFYFRLDGKMAQLHSKLNEFAANLSKLHTHLITPPHYELAGMSFLTDSSELAYKPMPFLIERKGGIGFAENHFYTKAGLHTDDQLGMIEKFEGLLAG